jgi:hypothetical protein
VPSALLLTENRSLSLFCSHLLLHLTLYTSFTNDVFVSSVALLGSNEVQSESGRFQMPDAVNSVVVIGPPSKVSIWHLNLQVPSLGGHIPC